MDMAVTRGRNRRKSRTSDEGELTDGAHRDIKEAREQMARGEYVTHEEVMAKYG
jgi:predicted transcriptional regulator